jgi:YegS/Rv2252/BmrU family lipid kinase
MLSLIVNPASGGGRAGRLLPAVTAELSRRGLAHHITSTTGLDHARTLARQAAADGEVAVAFGGDGLVGAIAGALHGTEAVMAILPGGRGNDFARVLGIPRDPVAACAVLSEATPMTLDLGEVDGQLFIGIASCGFDSVANRIANDTRLVRGNLVYAYGGLRALLGWRPATFKLRLDGQERTLRGYTVAVANSPAYGGGMLLAPDATLTDGQFDVVLIADGSRLQFLANLPRVFRGTHVTHPMVEVVRARVVEIDADRPFTLYADGDPIAELPVTVTALPGAVRVLVPASAAGFYPVGRTSDPVRSGRDEP